MKNKLGIFTALILSLVLAGSAFALPWKTASVNKPSSSKSKVNTTKKKKTKKHHKKKAAKKPATTTTTTPKK